MERRPTHKDIVELMEAIRILCVEHERLRAQQTANVLVFRAVLERIMSQTADRHALFDIVRDRSRSMLDEMQFTDNGADRREAEAAMETLLDQLALALRPNVTASDLLGAPRRSG